MSKSPSIQTNEGPPERRVTIKCDIVTAPDSTYPVVLKPYKLSVSRAGEIEIDESSLAITNVSDQDLKVKVIDAPPGYFKVTVPKTIKKGEKGELILKVNPDYLKDPFEKSVTLEFDDPANSRFTVPVLRRLIGQEAQTGTKGQAAASTPSSLGKEKR